ncbi:MAG: class I SAM-dependent methyltransferase [Kiloniellales bacterium]|nr:class I SAM-dependent methyltransferase [Kiloniellales bacterium]
MSYRPTPLTEDLHRYLLEVSLREPALLARLREETARRGDAGMQISPEQGQFMAFLIELTGARRVLEIGTFTGYSALSMALALPPEGRIIACDIEPETTAVARRYWAEAGVAEKIDLRLAPALDTLEGLLAEGAAESFDFAFIDADKENYEAYYERCLALLRQGGLLAVDNVLWNGAVADPAARDPDTEAIRALNLRMRKDPRISLSMVPISDGLSLARKR